MVLCKFYFRGTCTKGERCKFDHFLNLKAVDDKLKENIVENCAIKFEKIIDINMILKGFQDDLLTAEKCKQSIFSCYGPFGGKPSYPGLIDKSFEEIRLEYHNAKKYGTLDQYKQHLKEEQLKFKSKLEKLQTPTDDIIDILKSIYNNQSVEMNIVSSDFGNTEKSKMALKTAMEKFDPGPVETPSFSRFINFSFPKPGYRMVNDITSLIVSVYDDMLINERGKHWVLSCYAPLIHRPLFPGLEDHSFEEVRLGFYEAKQSKTVEKYEEKLDKLFRAAKAKFKQLQNPSGEMIVILENILHNKMDLIDVAIDPFEVIFSNSVFGENSQAKEPCNLALEPTEKKKFDFSCVNPVFSQKSNDTNNTKTSISKTLSLDENQLKLSTLTLNPCLANLESKFDTSKKQQSTKIILTPQEKQGVKYENDSSLNSEQMLNILLRKINNLENSFQRNSTEDLRDIISELKQENKNLRETNESLLKELQKLVAEVKSIKEKIDKPFMANNDSNNCESVKKDAKENIQMECKEFKAELQTNVSTKKLIKGYEVNGSVSVSNSREQHEMNVEQSSEPLSGITKLNVFQIGNKHNKPQSEEKENKNLSPTKDSEEKFKNVQQAVDAVSQYVLKNNKAENLLKIPEKMEKVAHQDPQVKTENKSDEENSVNTN